ncbi:tripartite tricarboxylate transporter TctB family protein [Glycomyces buryatensis]|uniref:Tripartite tricarboxylate transporter TctB family protein n=1 Tax=Glycomyces buryatensis TaxID=2570927 RepID=A0A4S8Q842_9ACTN|nr:tripartite tricarboxylate transporter TctB family protein [Glycomyces buryatensis]THV40547.1 tripartite tricarboxylate transporter TctB family protein [Glycomyces buryatensis]
MTMPDETAVRLSEEEGRTPPRGRDLAQLWVCGFLVLLGILAIIDASRLGGFSASNDPIGPKPVPIILGILLFVVAGCYALDVLRGGRGEAENGEDDGNFDWRTVGLLCAVFIANAVLIDWLGWVISGALLFWGAAIVLGSRRYLLTAVAAVVLSLATFYGFAIGLGVGLPAGVLQGIL